MTSHRSEALALRATNVSKTFGGVRALIDVDVDPFGGFGRTISVVIALITLQAIATGLNLLGANQHLATGLWGAFLVMVMVVRWFWTRYRLAERSEAKENLELTEDR